MTRARLVAGLAIVVSLAACLVATTHVAVAEVDLTPVRLAGVSRVETAALLAQAAFPEGAEHAVVASVDAPADALAASGLAGAVRGPVLLVTRDALPEATATALSGLGVEAVHLLGGEAAISPAVESQLAATVDVVRIAGDDREATAALVADRIAELTGTTPTRVLVAGSGAASDALTAGGLAWSGALPILLTPADTLHPATAAALDALAGPTAEPSHEGGTARVEAVVVGGEAAVSEVVAAEIAARGVAVQRVAGASRAGTAVAVADLAGAASRVLLVASDDPVDALGAAPLAATGTAAVLPVGRDGVVPPEVAAWLAARCGTGVVVQALGGEAAVPPDAVDAALRAVRDCDPAPGTTVRFATAVDPAVPVDPAAFSAEVTAILTDPRGWGTPDRLTFTPVGEAHDLGVILAGEATLAAAGPACVAAGGCRLGRDLLADARLWQTSAGPPGDAAAPGVDDATRRAGLVNRLVGLWIGEPGPFGDWPDAAQRERVADRYAPQAVLAFGGDVHGEARVAALLAAGGSPFAPVADRLAAADLSVVNLETPISTRGTPAPDKPFTFRAPPAMAGALAAAGVDLVSLANNHALDFGVDALLDTFAFLELAGVRWVGAGRNAAEAYAPVVLDTPVGPVAFVGLTRVLHTLAWAAGPDRPGLASAYDEAAAVAAVQAAAELADLVVVTIHWGVERADCPDGYQRHLARLLTEAGADLVTGHHPHVLQGIQTRADGTLVAYSLGNFVWYHSAAPSSSTGVLEVTLPGNTWTLHPAVIGDGGAPFPVGGAAAAAIHARVAARSPGGSVGCAF